MFDALAAREISAGSETQALQFLQSFSHVRAGYLSATSHQPQTAALTYAAIWRSKGRILQLLQHRHRAAQAGSETIRKQWDALADVRQTIGRILTQPIADLKKRDQYLSNLIERRDKLERDLAGTIPEIERTKKLAKVEVNDFVSMLPKKSAFVDFYRYSYGEKGKFQGFATRPSW